MKAVGAYVPAAFLIQKGGYDIMSIISVNNLTYYYDGCDEAVYENVSFTLDTTWKNGAYRQERTWQNHT